MSDAGAEVACELQKALAGADLFVHAGVGVDWPGTRFERIVDLTAAVYRRYRRLVYLMPCGIVVRALAPLLGSKYDDPAVVVGDVGARWVVSLLSGHEGGANDLALAVANALGAEPVVTTTTEALRTLIVGIGCRRGIAAAVVLEAVHEALNQAASTLAEVRLLASVDLKRDEAGLLEAAATLGLPLRFLSAAEIRNCVLPVGESAAARRHLNLPAVAEPAALLAGRRTTLVLPKLVHRGVTVALARESCLWSASVPATPPTAPAAPRKPSGAAT